MYKKEDDPKSLGLFSHPQNEEEQWVAEGTFYLWQMRISFLTLYWWTIRKFGHIYPYCPSSAGWGSTYLYNFVVLWISV